MASLFNTKISNTYVGLIKTIDNAVISASLRELTDGSGNQTGVYLNNAGDFKASGTLEFGSLKDTGENITITKFVDEADGIASNDNDTTIPTSAAVVDYVAAKITLEDLDFSGDSGTGSVDLDSQTFAVVGTANEIETSAGSQQLQIGLPDNVTIGGNLQVNGLLKGNNNIVVKDTSDRTMAAFYGGGKSELYFNDSKKFETTSDGATVTGGLTATGGSVFTGATFSSDVDFVDSAKARFGTDNDLQIYHSSGSSVIDNTIGDLIIKNSQDDGDVIFQSDNGSGGIDTYFILDGGQTRVEFAKGTQHYDNVIANFGTSSDLKIYHNGTDSFIQNGTGDLDIINSQDDGNIVFTSDDGSGGTTEYFRVDGGTELTYFSKDLKLNDNVNLLIGSGSADLQLYHTGSISYIRNNTGDLDIRNQTGSAADFYLRNTSNNGVQSYITLEGANETTLFGIRTKHSDNIKAMFGDSNDFQIYHDGSNSYLNDTGTGELKLLASSVAIQSATGNEYIAYFAGTGGQTASLYAGNSKKFETTSTGVTITGVAVADGLDMGDNEKIRLGDSQDLEIYHDASNSYIKDNGTGSLFLQGSNIFIQSSLSKTAILCNDSASVDLYYNASKKFETTNTGISVTGVTDTDGITSSAEIDVNLANEGKYFEGGSGNIRRLSITSGTNTSAHALHTFNINSSNGKYKFDINGTEEFSIDSSNASLGGNLTIAGDLTVNGTTTTVNTDTLAVEDPLISMAKDNSANSVDIGFYGRYNDGSNRYLGLFSDASDSNKFTLFKGLTVEPTTTVDTSATGYARADLNVANLEATGDLKVEDNIYITDSTTTRAKIQLNSGDRDNLDIKAVSLGSTMSFYTVDTLALTLDASQNAQFSEAVLIADNKKLEFGGSGDLKIYHTAGGSSYIEATTGNLEIKNTADDGRITFISDDGSGGTETYFYLDGLGGGSQPFTVFPDNAVLAMGTNHDTYIQHTGSHFKIDNYTGNLQITNNTDDGDITFSTDNGSGGTTEYMRLDGSGQYIFISSSLGMYFADGCALRLGSDSDITMYHDNSNGYITNSTGILNINNNDIRFKTSGDETMLRAVANGAVELMYNNSTKLETTTGGIKISGTNANNKVESYFDGDYTSGFKFSDLNGGIWYDAGADDLTVSAGHANSKMLLNSGGALALTLDESQNATLQNLTTINKANSGAEGGSLLLRNASGGSGAYNRIYFAPTSSAYATRSAIIEGQNTDGNNNMSLIFKTSAGADPTEKMRIDNNGNVTIQKSALYVGNDQTSGVTEVVLTNKDTSLVDAGDIQNKLRMRGLFYDQSNSLLVETQICSGHEAANGNGNSFLAFYTQSGGSSPTEKVRITSGGKTGIGVTPTNANLEVKSIQDSSFDEGIGVIRSNSSQTGYINMVGGAMNINAPSAIPIKFRDGGTENLTIGGDGKISASAEATFMDVKYSNYSVGSLDTTGVTVATVTGASNGSSAIVEFVGSGGIDGLVDVVFHCVNDSGNWTAYKNSRQTAKKVDVDVSGNGTGTITFTFKSLSGSQAYTPRLMRKGSPSALVTF